MSDGRPVSQGVCPSLLFSLSFHFLTHNVALFFPFYLTHTIVFSFQSTSLHAKWGSFLPFHFLTKNMHSNVALFLPFHFLTHNVTLFFLFYVFTNNVVPLYTQNVELFLSFYFLTFKNMAFLPCLPLSYPRTTMWLSAFPLS